MFEPIIECMQEKRTKRQWIKLFWQKLYLRKLNKQKEYTWLLGEGTKRAMNKALRNRLVAMLKAESYAHHADWLGTGYDDKKKLEAKNKKERLMIHSILEDMYDAGITPDYLGTA